MYPTSTLVVPITADRLREAQTARRTRAAEATRRAGLRRWPRPRVFALGTVPPSMSDR